MKLALIALLAVLATPSFAYEEEQAVNNFAHEAAECAAFYLIGSVAPGLGKETSQKLVLNAAVVFELSMKLTSKELTNARMLLATESMKRDMKHNWSNVSIVLQKYGFPCKDFSEDPEARLTYWLAKQD